MSRGFIKLHRGWHDSPDFHDGPYCERAAWCWLLSNVAWRDTHRRTAGGIVPIKRGQMHVSLRSLASVWGWSKGKVERFLDVLETGHSIGQQTGHAGRIITICNFDKYQARDGSGGTLDGTPSGTRTGHERDTQEESKEDKEEKNIDGAGAPYAFLGRVIRLTARDYDQWRKSFSNLDLRAELQARDDWLSTQGVEAHKTWFIRTSNWLAKRNDEAGRNKQPAIPI